MEIYKSSKIIHNFSKSHFQCCVFKRKDIILLPNHIVFYTCSDMNKEQAYLARIVFTVVLGGLLFGYDTAVISGAEKGLQAFFLQAQDFQYTDVWHGITSSSALIGCIFGCLISGWYASKFGRKMALLLSGIFFLLSAIQSYYPEFLFFEYGRPSFTLLIAFNLYRILGGIGVGMASAICPMYIAEISPAEIRGKLVSCNQFTIILGQLVVYLVNYFIVGDHTNPVIEKISEGIYILDTASSDSWSVSTGWRYMFVSEAIPAAIFTLLICFIPETPRFLVMNGNDKKAFHILTRINGYDKARQILEEIKENISPEKKNLFAYGWTVIFIGIMLCVFQQITGINAVMYFGPRIFGSFESPVNPMASTVMVGVVNIIMTIVSIFLIERIGRKPLLVYGVIGMAMGAAGIALSNILLVPSLIPLLCVLFYIACFGLSWGPVCWVLVSEIFPNTIRSKAMGLASAFVWISNFVVSFTFIPIYNMSIGELGVHFGHIAVYAVYGVCCIIAAVFVWRLVPETKGKTLEKMNSLWK